MKALLICSLLLLVSPDIELQKRSLLNGKIELLVPTDFVQMSKEDIKLKYPGKNNSDVILTNNSGTINIGVKIIEEPMETDEIEDYLVIYKVNLLETQPGIQWINEKIVNVNGKRVGLLKFSSQARDTRIFNCIFFTDIDHKLFLASFNCIEKEKVEWEPISEKIVNSLKFK